ncbi:hypothetical protein M3Y99_00499100 [Aphelenchoides fujianensis]|nr:hypothetical protein M3Y99_00499100 [Aphelenchoides fujianensis]
MFFSLLRAAKPRQDRRPLYRRIFTNRRLDLAHKLVVRGMLGFIVFSASYCIVNGIIYYNSSKRISPASKSSNKQTGMSNLVGRVLGTIGQSYAYIFLFGAAGGAGFELFKIHFSVKGVSYYTVFKHRQLEKELAKFESGLKQTEQEIQQFVQQQKAALSQS